MDATDVDSIGNDNIDIVIIRITASMSPDFSSPTTFSGIRTSFPTSTLVRYKFECDADYYGPSCTVFCVPHFDASGYYACSSTGDKICLAGYSGTDCTIGELLYFNYYVFNKQYQG